jgi:CheY-like chemotaxis protein
MVWPGSGRDEGHSGREVSPRSSWGKSQSATLAACVFCPTEPEFRIFDAVSSRAARPTPWQPMSTGKILLVEDEVMIALSLHEGLGEAGFEVETVHNGREAATALDGACASYSALLTDIRLPIGGPNGFDLGHKARELSPDIAVTWCDQCSRRLLGPLASIIALARPQAAAGADLGLHHLLCTTIGPWNWFTDAGRPRRAMTTMPFCPLRICP